MFNIGSNDKEELEENMEEIKNLIGKSNEGGENNSRGSNSSPSAQETQGSGSENADGPQTDIGSPQSSGNQGQDNLGDTPTDPKNGNLNNQGQSFTSQQENNGLQRGKNNIQGQENLQNQDQPRQDNVLNTESNNQAQEDADTPNQQEESVPDEPLFLREAEFNKIREMIEGMTYLTEEMDQKVKDMKRNVREEKGAYGDSRELSKAFDERRREIKSVIESSS
jgi:hypothetical protein